MTDLYNGYSRLFNYLFKITIISHIFYNRLQRIAHINNPPLVAAAEECAEFPQCTNCRLGGPMLKLAKLVVCVCEFSISLVFVCLELVVPPTYVYEYIQIWRGAANARDSRTEFVDAHGLIGKLRCNKLTQILLNGVILWHHFQLICHLIFILEHVRYVAQN